MTPTITGEFSPEEHERLLNLTDDPAALLHDAVMGRVNLDEAIAFTQSGGFAGPEGFQKLVDSDGPTWPLGALCGIEVVSMGGGESR